MMTILAVERRSPERLEGNDATERADREIGVPANGAGSRTAESSISRWPTQGLADKAVRAPLLAPLLLCVFALLPFAARAATNELSSALQTGLFEEEANRNLPAAIAAYEQVAKQFDQNRALAATAVFRLGEVNRKLGKTNEAAAFYQRILREFADQDTLAKLSRQNLVGMLPTSPAPAGWSFQERLREIIETASQTGGTNTSFNERLRQLVEQTDAANSPGRPITAVLDEEETEIRRIQAMIQNSPDLINAPSSDDKLTPLCRAASRGQLRVAEFLLKNGSSINRKAQGKAPLHYAATGGHKSMVELLLRNGANPNIAENPAESLFLADWTPLHYAAAMGFRSVAEALLAGKGDVDARSANGETPLFVAADRGRDEMVALLISQKADVNARGWGESVPLIAAALKGGSPGVVSKLIAAGALPDAADNTGRTALSFAAEKGHVDIVNLLLVAKADPNAGKWNLPLHCAIKAKSAGIVEALLKAGADVNRAANLKWRNPGSNFDQTYGKEITPLAVAVDDEQFDLIKLLLAHKADPNGKNKDGLPLIFSAVNNAELTKAFLNAGANPNAENRSGQPPVPVLMATSDAKVINLLLAGGANPEVRRFGQTALLQSAGWDNPAALGLVSALLEGGANVNARTEDGRTALHMAAANKNKELMELLIAYKADVNARDNQGLTPLDYAAGKNQLAAPGVPVPPVPGERPISDSNAVADLLRKHGGLADLPKLDRIEVTRPEPGYRETVFMADTNGWNRFTLLEVVQAFYERFTPYDANPSLPFPDLTRLVVHRPSRTPGGKEQVISVNLLNHTNGVDCAKDMLLEFGDRVEIPAREHPLNEKAVGLTQEQMREVQVCITKRYQVVVRGERTAIKVAGKNWSYLSRALDAAKGTILSSSDLSRVKVTRKDAKTGKVSEFIVDTTRKPSETGDLWLRDGDVIEVPEK